MNLDQQDSIQRYNSSFQHFIPSSPFKRDQNTFILRDGHKIRKRGKKNNCSFPKSIITQVELMKTIRCSTSPDAPKPRRFSTSINEKSIFEEFELVRTFTGGVSRSNSIRKDSFMEKGEELEPMCKSLFRQETQTTQSENPEVVDKIFWNKNEEKINKIKRQRLRRDEGNKKQCMAHINKVNLNCELHKNNIEIGTHTIHYIKNLHSQSFKAPYVEKLNEIKMEIKEYLGGSLPLTLISSPPSRPHTSANLTDKRRQVDKNKGKGFE